MVTEYGIATIVGIVEGVTEFLPISSTGHMILVGSLLGFEGEVASVFEVFIQLGAILSILLLYRRRFIEMCVGLFRNGGTATPTLGVWHIAVGIVPVMGIGYLLHKPIKLYLFSPTTVVVGLILGAVLMLAAERWAVRREPQVQSLDEISLKQAFVIGLFQIFALWPGFSRSGSTISGGLFVGVSRTAAAEYSFLIAVPLMLVACVYDLMKSWNQLNSNDLWMIVVGFVVAFLVAYVSVVWFLRFLNSSTLAAFAYYRFILAAFSYWYLVRH